MDSAHDTRLRRVGCPIRRSPDQSLLAAPRGLSQRATSFIASWRQGIHQMPLLSSTHPSDNRTLAPRRRAPSAREGRRDAAAARAGDQATTCKKHTHAFSTHAPDGREGGRASMLASARSRTTHRRPKTGLDARERAVITTSRCERSSRRRAGGGSPRQPRLLVRRTGSARAKERAGKGFPLAFGARTGQAAHRGAAAPPGAATERWWAWADLNGRPHAYQACALTS
jgi:hypothetical protein